MLWQRVIGRTHQPGFPADIVLPHDAEDGRGDGEHHHQHPHDADHPDHHLPAEARRDAARQHQHHHPVHAHQHDEEDGGVHVGVAQVEDGLAHEVAVEPGLLGQVDDEQDAEGHDEAVGAGQVEDEDGGDRAVLDAGQDAPDDEEVAGDAQQEDHAEDEGAQGRGVVVAHHARVLGEAAVASRHVGGSFLKPEEGETGRVGACLICLSLPHSFPPSIRLQ